MFGGVEVVVTNVTVQMPLSAPFGTLLALPQACAASSAASLQLTSVWRGKLIVEKCPLHSGFFVLGSRRIGLGWLDQVLLCWQQRLVRVILWRWIMERPRKTVERYGLEPLVYCANVQSVQVA
jgi:hypothetical protein